MGSYAVNKGRVFFHWMLFGDVLKNRLIHLFGLIDKMLETGALAQPEQIRVGARITLACSACRKPHQGNLSAFSL